MGTPWALIDSLDIISILVKWLLWDGNNLVKELIHQTTAIVASLVTIHSVNPSLSFSQGSKRFFSFVRGKGVAKKRLI